ncbi:MAG: hypothetical protein IKY33_01515 [Clostridia bacterium]|nr:hypothetical protein [Clostridia bacterium]
MNRKETLEKAMTCVLGQREQDYGTPEDNFAIIAGLWSVYLGTEVDAEDVALMMALLKIARCAAGTGKEDNYIDLAGYAACAAEIATNQNKKAGF